MKRTNYVTIKETKERIIEALENQKRASISLMPGRTLTTSMPSSTGR